MRRTILFLMCAASLVVAQRIPGSYIVEFKTEPAAALTAAKGARYSSADPEAQARRSQIQTEHQGLEARIQVLGGRVTHRYSTLINGMAVQLTDQAAATVRQMPEVKSVSPVHRHHLLMDQAVKVHRIDQVWQTLSGGQANAGAGIKIGILDCGVDNTHPAFSSFTTSMPSGFPIVNGGLATTANVNNKVIVARVYSDVANGYDNTGTDAGDYCLHGTTVAGIAAAGTTDPKFVGIAPLSGVAPGAWIGNYKVADDGGSSDDVTFIAGLEDAVSDGMNVVNYSSGSLIYGLSEETGTEAAAIAQAVANGVVFVGAAGNDGPNGGYFGAGLGTVSFPAAVPAAISVGATENQRFFWFGATVAGTAYLAIPSFDQLTEQALNYVTGDITGNIVDVAQLTSDTSGYACNSLPANSLTNSVALIQRGSPNTSTCTFQTKLNNAQNAGAIGAIIYDNTNRSFFDYTLSGYDVLPYELGFDVPPVDANGNYRVVVWQMGNATLPAVMVSQADGQSIKQSISSGVSADLDFDGKTPLPYPANTVSDFSSLGPTPLGNLKPDLVAVGNWLVAPATTQNEVSGCASIGSANNCYTPYTFLDSPFILEYFNGANFIQLSDFGAAGTSYASPMVAGSAAVLMAAKPSLTSAQYRSLLTNGAAELDIYPNNTLAVPQTAGAGKLDLLGSLRAGLTAVPSTLNFAPVTVASSGSTSSLSPIAARIGHHGLSREDAAAAGSAVSQTISITNVGSSSDTFSAVVTSIMRPNSSDGASTPTVGSASFTLAAGASTNLTVSLPSGLAAGQYHGFVVVTGTQGQTPLRVPYWYGVVGPAANVLGLYLPGVDPPACTDYIDFRILDASGMPVPSSPTVTTASSQAAVVRVYPISDFVGNYDANNYVPGTFEAQITTGRPDVNGNNVFTISSGSFNQDVTFSIDNSGATLCSNAAAITGTNSRRPVSKLAGSKFAGTKKLDKKKAIDH